MAVKTIRTARLTGQVVKWNDQQGFGFIHGEDNDDYFVFYTNIMMEGRKSLVEGQQVAFTPCNGEKGLNAVAVEPKVRIKATVSA